MGPERSADTLSRDDGVSDFGTITTITESPVKAGVFYVGTDDGQVQMTRGRRQVVAEHHVDASSCRARAG